MKNVNRDSDSLMNSMNSCQNKDKRSVPTHIIIKLLKKKVKRNTKSGKRK